MSLLTCDAFRRRERMRTEYVAWISHSETFLTLSRPDPDYEFMAHHESLVLTGVRVSLIIAGRAANLA